MKSSKKNKNNSINNILDSSSIQEALRSLNLNPMKEVAKSFEPIINPNLNSMKMVPKGLESIINPNLNSMKKVAKSFEPVINPNLDPMKGLSKSFESIVNSNLNSMKMIPKSFELIIDPNLNSMQKIRKNLEKMTKSYNSSELQTSLNKLSKTIDLYSGLEVDFKDEVKINEDYLQSAHNEEIVRYANEVSDILQDESMSIIERVDKIIKKICMLYENTEEFFSTHPIAYDLIKIIIPILLVGLFQLHQLIENAYDNFTSISHSITENYYIDNKSFNKSIKKEVSKELSTTKEADKNYLLNTYRFVNCESLNIRNSNTMKSESKYKLPQGAIVRILNKQKNWAKIEYKNEDETVIIIGWVNTRYISRFK